MSALKTNGAMMRFSMFMAAALLCGCATDQEPFSRSIADNSALELDRHQASEFSFLDRPISAQTLADRGAEVVEYLKVERNVNFELSRMPRTELASFSGGREMAAVRRHEATLQSEIDKTENILVEPPATPILIADNNGAWRETEDSYIHSFSGMVCPKSELTLVSMKGDQVGFVAMPLQNIHVFDDLGYDTACHYESKMFGIVFTFYASRWPDVSLDDHFGRSVSQILEQLPVTTETLSVTAEAEVEDGYDSTIEGDTRSVAFLLETQDDTPYKTALWLNKTGSWHVKARASFAMHGDEDDVSFTEIFAATSHATKLVGIDKHINTSAGGVDVSY